MDENFKKFVDNYKAWKFENHKETDVSRKELLTLSRLYEKQIKEKLSGNVPDDVIKNYFS
jgi:hypothetical protein